MRLFAYSLSALLTAAPLSALEVGPELSIQVETEPGSGLPGANPEPEATGDEAENRVWVRSAWPADLDFSPDPEHQFLLDTVVSSDGATLGEVVEASEAEGNALRLFVDVADEVSAREERAILTLPATAEDSDGRLVLPLTEAEFAEELDRASP